MLSRRVRDIGSSPTLRVNDEARRLRAENVDVLDFSAGQPDFPTPQQVKDAGVRAIERDQTRYTANAGILELRQAVVQVLERSRDLEYTVDQVLVSPGAKTSLYFACMALLDPDDEAIVPAPYWTSYPEQVRLAGGRPVFVATSEGRGFKLGADELESAITPRTKLLILNDPSNPTGASYDRAELEALGEVCLRHDLWVIADEIYSRLLYDGRSFVSMAQIAPELRERTLIIDGVSKTYAMTGWRIGYAVGPHELIAGMARLQSHATSNATSISQWASLEALALGDDILESRRLEFQGRRDAILRCIDELPGVSCVRPQGAFYVFPNVSGRFGEVDGRRVDSGQAMATYLLERARVAVVPGEAFGSSAHLRLSYAVSLEDVLEGMRRIAEALAPLARR